MIRERAKAKNHGQMVRHLKVSTKTVRKMVEDILFGQMVQTTEESSKIITSTEKATTYGLMEDHLMEIGKTIKCMDMGYSLGRMEEDMKGTISMTKSTVREYSTGQMVEYMMVNGLMGNKMELEDTDHLIRRRNLENGSQVRDSDGWKEKNSNILDNKFLRFNIFVSLLSSFM